MAKRRPRKWQQKAGISKHKGALHRQLHIPEDEPIPTGTLAKLRHAAGKLGHRVRYALIARGYYGKGFKHHHGPLSKASLTKRRRRARHGHTR